MRGAPVHRSNPRGLEPSAQDRTLRDPGEDDRARSSRPAAAQSIREEEDQGEEEEEPSLGDRGQHSRPQLHEHPDGGDARWCRPGKTSIVAGPSPPWTRRGKTEGNCVRLLNLRWSWIPFFLFAVTVPIEPAWSHDPGPPGFPCSEGPFGVPGL